MPKYIINAGPNGGGEITVVREEPKPLEVKPLAAPPVAKTKAKAKAKPKAKPKTTK